MSSILVLPIVLKLSFFIHTVRSSVSSVGLSGRQKRRLFAGSLVQFARPSHQNSVWEVSALALRLGIPSSFTTILHNYRLACCLDRNGIEALRQGVSLISTSNAHEPELSPKNPFNKKDKRYCTDHWFSRPPVNDSLG